MGENDVLKISHHPLGMTMRMFLSSKAITAPYVVVGILSSLCLKQLVFSA